MQLPLPVEEGNPALVQVLETAPAEEEAPFTSTRLTTMMTASLTVETSNDMNITSRNTSTQELLPQQENINPSGLEGGVNPLSTTPVQLAPPPPDNTTGGITTSASIPTFKIPPTPFDIEAEPLSFHNHETQHVPQYSNKTITTVTLDGGGIPITARIEIDGQDSPHSAVYMKIRRTYPAAILEGRMTQCMWDNRFCNEIDAILHSYLSAKQDNLIYQFVLALVIASFIALRISSYDDYDEIQNVFTGLLLFLMFMVGLCYFGFQSSYAIQVLERDVEEKCHDFSRMMMKSTTSDTSAATEESNTCDLMPSATYTGSIIFLLKYDLRTYQAGKRRAYYKVYYIELQLLSSTTATTMIQQQENKRQENKKREAKTTRNQRLSSTREYISAKRSVY
jgi:hypothetical protein